MFNEVAGVGETPLAQNFFAAYNDPQSPWIQLFRAAVFDDADDATIDQLNDAHHHGAPGRLTLQLEPSCRLGAGCMTGLAPRRHSQSH